MYDWKLELSKMIKAKDEEKMNAKEKTEKLKAKIKTFYSDKVIPAFKELEIVLEQNNRQVEITEENELPILIVGAENYDVFKYSLSINISNGIAMLDENSRVTDSHRRNLPQITVVDIINSFMLQYGEFLDRP